MGPQAAEATATEPCNRKQKDADINEALAFLSEQDGHDTITRRFSGHDI